MATTSTQRFARAFQALPKLAETTAKVAVVEQAKNGKANAEKSVRDATNGKARLRNAGPLIRSGTRVVGKKGAPLTVRTKPRSDGTQLVSAEGPWPLIENDTKRHFIGAAGLSKKELGIGFVVSRSKSGRSTAKGRLGRARAIRTPYGLRRYAEVAGTKGKKPWQKAFKKTAAEAPQVLKKVSQEQTAKMIRGVR